MMGRSTSRCSGCQRRASIDEPVRQCDISANEDVHRTKRHGGRGGPHCRSASGDGQRDRARLANRTSRARQARGSRRRCDRGDRRRRLCADASLARSRHRYGSHAGVCLRHVHRRAVCAIRADYRSEPLVTSSRCIDRVGRCARRRHRAVGRANDVVARRTVDFDGGWGIASDRLQWRRTTWRVRIHRTDRQAGSLTDLFVERIGRVAFTRRRRSKHLQSRRSDCVSSGCHGPVRRSVPLRRCRRAGTDLGTGPWHPCVSRVRYDAAADVRKPASPVVTKRGAPHAECGRLFEK